MVGSGGLEVMMLLFEGYHLFGYGLNESCFHETV